MHNHPKARDIDPAALYAAINARQAEARKRRIESGAAGYSDLDEAGRKAYKARKQTERRAKLAAQQAATGSAPFNAENMRAAIIDAVLAMAAAGDERADAVLSLAATAFAVPEAAADSIRRRATKHRARVLRTTDKAK